MRYTKVVVGGDSWTTAPFLGLPKYIRSGKLVRFTIKHTVTLPTPRLIPADITIDSNVCRDE